MDYSIWKNEKLQIKEREINPNYTSMAEKDLRVKVSIYITKEAIYAVTI